MSGSIAAASNQQQAQAQMQVNLAVAQKTLGVMESQGRSMVALIEDAAQSQQALQARASEPGKGEHIDAQG
jgi:formamidopyrimidine-DNA glycosylase